MTGRSGRTSRSPTSPGSYTPGPFSLPYARPALGWLPAEGAAAPFLRGRWLFSHNGVIDDYPESVAPLAASLPAERLLQLEAATDSALLWALVSDRLERGLGLGQALGETVDLLEATCKGRFNFLLTDGEQIAATAYGNSLFLRRTAEGVIVASEPSDDGPGWDAVPDRSLVLARADEATVTAL